MSHGHRSGGKRSPTYQSWRSMHERCRREGHPCYLRYGGRGIVVCERWTGRDGFANFLADVGERPSLYHSLGRKHVDDMYEPGRVGWETELEQANNNSRSKFVTIKGMRMSLSRAVREHGRPGIKYSTVLKRVWRGINPEAAILI